jgi:hypothetical protein
MAGPIARIGLKIILASTGLRRAAAFPDKAR